MLKGDVLIVGAGIAGLWAANRLQQQGLSVVILETNRIGSQQTIHTQGIIHGGIKYSLSGTLSDATRSIANMPHIWEACLKGHGDVDLSDARVMSEHYHLWSPTKNLSSNLGTLIASNLLRGKNKKLRQVSYPPLFNHSDFKGHVYQVAERVVDISSVLRALTRPLANRIYQVKHWHTVTSKNSIQSFTVQSQSESLTTLIDAQRYLFTAGAGNEAICHPPASSTIQKRPLHMVYVRLDQDLPFYGHCIGLQSVPRLSITTHYTHQGHCIWYLGGKIAEDGVHRDAEAQCQLAREELTALFPWLPIDNWTFHSFLIDRVEQQQAQGTRPNSFHLELKENMMIAWPTKLAFAPGLAETIVKSCESLVPRADEQLIDWPMPEMAQPIWETL